MRSVYCVLSLTIIIIVFGQILLFPVPNIKYFKNMVCILYYKTIDPHKTFYYRHEYNTNNNITYFKGILTEYVSK